MNKVVFSGYLSILVAPNEYVQDENVSITIWQKKGQIWVENGQFRSNCFGLLYSSHYIFHPPGQQSFIHL